MQMNTVFNRLKLWFASAGLVITGLAAAYFWGRKDQQRGQENKQLKTKLNAYRKKTRVQEKIDTMSAKKRRDELGKWSK